MNLVVTNQRPCRTEAFILAFKTFKFPMKSSLKQIYLYVYFKLYCFRTLKDPRDNLVHFFNEKKIKDHSDLKCLNL